MGQYYYIVNIDKGECLHPHKFNDGLKLMEFGDSGSGTMLGLAILLADSNGRGGGDLHSDHSCIGTWAGDRIVIAGDYADDLQAGDNICIPSGAPACVPDAMNLHRYADEWYDEISDVVIVAIIDGEGEHHPLAKEVT